MSSRDLIDDLLGVDFDKEEDTSKVDELESLSNKFNELLGMIPIADDGTREREVAVDIISKIIERREATDRFNLKNDILLATIENSNDVAIYSLDRDFNLLNFSKSFADMIFSLTGHTLFIGANALSFINDEEIEMFKNVLKGDTLSVNISSESNEQTVTLPVAFFMIVLSDGSFAIRQCSPSRRFIIESGMKRTRTTSDIATATLVQMSAPRVTWKWWLSAAPNRGRFWRSLLQRRLLMRFSEWS